MENMVPGTDSPSHIPAPSGASSLTGPVALIKQAWATYKLHAKSFISIILLQVVAIAVLVFFVFLLGFLGGAVAIASKTTSGTALGTGAIIVLAIFYILAIIIAVWGQLSMIMVLKSGSTPLGPINAYKQAWPKLPAYLWVSILTMLAVWGGFTLLIIPGILFVIWFFSSTFIAAEGEHKGISALLYSKHITYGKWWAILWRIVFILLAMFGLVIVLGIVFGILGAIGAAILPKAVVAGLAFIVFALFYIALYLVVVPTIFAYQYALYTALKQHKSATPFTPTSGGRTFIMAISIIGIVGFGAFMAYSLTHQPPKKQNDEWSKLFKDLEKEPNGNGSEVEFTPSDYENLDTPEELQLFLEQLNKQSETKQP